MGEQKQSLLWGYVMYSRRFNHLFLLILSISLFTHCLKIQYSPLDTSQPGIAGIIALIAPGLMEMESNSNNGSPGVQITESGGSTFTLGGTVSGLAGTLVLTNGGVDKSITANGSYSFDLAISSGSSYNVTVKTQPTNVTCTVSNATGTITANVTNINVGCNCPGPDSPVTRNWGTFTDQCNGVVSLAVNAGTFGGQTYTAQTLTWMKCSHGQVWNSGANDCTGTGTASLWGATEVQYCNVANESCNDATTKLLNGTGTSGAYTACDALNAGAGTFGKTNWRVPIKNELKLLIECTDTTILPNDGTNCGGSPSPSINNLFPNTVALNYWSSSAYVPAIGSAWYVRFSSGIINATGKTSNGYVRCVSGP
jgi:hypothetical protein